MTHPPFTWPGVEAVALSVLVMACASSAVFAAESAPSDRLCTNYSGVPEKAGDKAGMIFIPCRGGFSHRPEEYASPEAIARGTEVLADTLAALAG